jgi:hypothetical protein
MALSGHLLSVVVFSPAFGALALLFLRGDDELWLWIRRLAIVVSTAEPEVVVPRASQPMPQVAADNPMERVALR